MALTDLSFCDGFLGEAVDQLDCSLLDFDIPVPVCITTADGGTEEVNLCDALANDVELTAIQFCADLLASIDAGDCEKFGLTMPVCVVTDSGQQKSFENVCAALAAGVQPTELTFCEGLLQAAMASLNLTDTEETNRIEQANLYPNPVRNELYIHLQGTDRVEMDAQIFSIRGNAIYGQKFWVGPTPSSHRLDVSSLPEGIYILRILTPAGHKSLKFVKN